MKTEQVKPEQEQRKAEAIEKDQAAVEKINADEIPMREDYARRSGSQASDEPGTPDDSDQGSRKA